MSQVAAEESLDEIVNWYATRRHYADPTGKASGRGQRRGLCRQVWGQTFSDHARSTKSWGGKPVDYAKLPLCAHCAKAKEKRNA